MKKLLISVLIFAVFAEFCFSAPAGVIDWDKQADTVNQAFQKLEIGLYPYAKTSCFVEKIVNRVIAPKPIFAWRVMFSIVILDDELAKEKKLPIDVLTQEGTENSYTDILLIEKNAGQFHLKTALSLSEQGKTFDDDSGLFVSKYGLNWRYVQSRYFRYIQYLGENDDVYVFAQGDLNVLLRIQDVLSLKNGDLIREEALARALDVRDETNLTARFAVNELVRKKEIKALPYIKKEIEQIAQSGETPYQHFVVLYLMDTPESDAVLCEFSKSNKNSFLEPLFNAVISCSIHTNEVPQEFMKNNPDPDAAKKYQIKKRDSLLPVYKRMLESRMGVIFAQDVLCEFPDGMRNVKMDLQKIADTPHSFTEYRTAISKLFVLDNPGKQTVHHDVSVSIPMLLLHSGEVPHSGQYVDLKEKSDLAQRYIEEDKKRIRPYINAVISAPEMSLNILTGIQLCLFDTNSPKVSRSYIQRVNRAGYEILNALPKDLVQREVHKLLLNSRKEKEQIKLDSIRLKCNL